MTASPTPYSHSDDVLSPPALSQQDLKIMDAIHRVFKSVDNNNRYVVRGFIRRYTEIPHEIVNIIIQLLGSIYHDTNSPIPANSTSSRSLFITKSIFPRKLCRDYNMHLWQQVLLNHTYPSIDTIIITHCALESEGVIQLCRGLKHACKNLKYLDLTGNEIGVSGTRAVALLIAPDNTDLDGWTSTQYQPIQNEADSSMLQTLILTDNNVGNTGCGYLGRSFCLTSNLKHVRLEKCQIAATGLKYLRRGIEQNSSITDLNIAGNDIDTSGAHDIGAWLSKNNSLIKLDISRNKLTPDGALRIAKGVVLNKSTLKYLRANINKIGQRGAAGFAKMLANDHTLEVLELSYNQLFDDGITLLAPGIALNHALKKLVLWFNGLTDEAVTKLAQTVKDRSRLQVFKQNMIDAVYDGTLKTLQKSLCAVVVEYLPVYMDFCVDISYNRRVTKNKTVEFMDMLDNDNICGVVLEYRKKSESTLETTMY